MFRKCSLFVCLTLTALSVLSSAHAADLYRWQDDEGNVHYTDRIPPQYVKQGYRVISEQGLTIQTIKSSDEEAAEQGDKPPQISKEQAIKDRRLLMTYGSEDEIIAARERKLADVQSLIELGQETISLLEVQFRQLAKEAGNYEKRGKAIPESLLTQVAATRRKISKYEARLKENEIGLETIKNDYDNDLQRYRQLKSAVENLDH